jgi:hypothetical protein
MLKWREIWKFDFWIGSVRPYLPYSLPSPIYRRLPLNHGVNLPVFYIAESQLLCLCGYVPRLSFQLPAVLPPPSAACTRSQERLEGLGVSESYSPLELPGWWGPGPIPVSLEPMGGQTCEPR